MAKAQILIVEDDGIAAMDIESRLKNHGYSVTGIANYAEKAIEKVEELKPDLVLMDIVLKGEMDGIEAAEIIRSRFEIPVVFLTAYADEERFERAKLTIPFGYILKPFQDRDLKITIEMALYTAKVDAERQQAEDALRESENRYQTLAESSPVGIFHTDAEGNCLYVNQRWCQISGLTPEEAHGEGWVKGLHPEDRERVFAEWYQAAEEQIPFKSEYRFQRLDGLNTWVFGQAVAERWDSGEIKGYVGTITDLTSRKQAEEALRRREEELNTIFDSVPAMIFYKDRNNKFIRINDALVKATGKPKEEIEGTSAFESYPEQGERYWEDDKEVMESGEPKRNIVEPMDTVYGTKWVQTDKIPYKDDQGNIIGVIGFAIDITDRKQAKEALQDSEEKYRLLIENANDAIFIAQDEIIKFSNPKTAAMIGYSAKELSEIPFANFIHPEDRDMVFERHKKRLKGEEVPTTYSFRIINKAGEDLWVELNAVFIRWNKKPATLNFLRDITAQTKMELQLRQAQKMESIGTLAGGIAHDFNNILFPIIGFAEMAFEDTSEGSSLRSSINEILHGAKRAGDLVKQILTFSRQSNQEPKPLKVQLIIKEALKLIRSSLPSTIKIKQHISNKCGLVMADPTQIHQVAMNLMTNAFQAMEDEGGKLEVTLKEVELGVDDLTDQSMTPGAYVCLTVADSGPGMDQSVISRIFEPYFTTKENGKGTGLGLAVVHGIVKSYKGDIKVYSEPGEGTAFHVYLPVIKSQVETEEADAVAPVPKGTERILLVDDEDSIVHMEKQMLERLGYHVTARTSSIEALEAFRASPGKFDLVITDMTMPNMTGIQLSQKLLEIRPDIPIIICTGFSNKIDNEKAKAFGIRGYVMKPVVMRELAKKMREVLDQD